MAQQLKLGVYTKTRLPPSGVRLIAAGPFSHTSLPRPALCRAAPTKKGAEKNTVRESTNGSDLPVFESNKDDQGEFLPVRNPGTFPNNRSARQVLMQPHNLHDMLSVCSRP